jgi:hypothetical protein
VRCSEFKPCNPTKKGVGGFIKKHPHQIRFWCYHSLSPLQCIAEMRKLRSFGDKFFFVLFCGTGAWPYRWWCTSVTQALEKQENYKFKSSQGLKDKQQKIFQKWKLRAGGGTQVVQSVCLGSMRPWVQIPVVEKKVKIRSTQESNPSTTTHTHTHTSKLENEILSYGNVRFQGRTFEKDLEK